MKSFVALLTFFSRVLILLLLSPAEGSNTFVNTGTLAAARYYHTATLLPTGKVLVAGGLTAGFAFLASGELFDPATGKWSATNFDGSGQFKFALVAAGGATTYWSNDGTSIAGSEPAAAVTLTVTKGLCSALLGDAALANMTIVPAAVFTNPEVHLRVWFDDGTRGAHE